MLRSMAVRENTVAAGRRRGADLNRMIGDELRIQRRAAGLSQARVAAAAGLSQAEVGRVERGVAPWLSVVNASAVLNVVGLRLWAKAYPAGPPLRDAAHLRLLAEFESRLHPSIRTSREWPIPEDSAGRAVDLLLTMPTIRIGVEAETVLNDLQALERELNLKRDAAGLDRVILLVRGSQRNRDILRGADALRRAYPLATRATLAALGAGRNVEADVIVVL
jgi:transcriptional regulator with XRE-family HTH domain